MILGFLIIIVVVYPSNHILTTKATILQGSKGTWSLTIVALGTGNGGEEVGEQCNELRRYGTTHRPQSSSIGVHI